MGTLLPTHVQIGSDRFRIDDQAEIPFRRISDSIMVPRTDVSGVPGAINLQRDVWLWQMTDFVGGEGRLVFDSADPFGPPTFFKTDGGVDVRVRGEFSLHPDEKLITNQTGGGSSPTITTWTNTDFTTESGTPTYSAGAAGNHVRLAVGDRIQSPARTPGTNVVRVIYRVVNAKTTSSNKKVSVELTVRNTTDSLNTVGPTTITVAENEPRTVVHNFTAAAGKTYRYWIKNADPGTGVTIDVKYVTEESFGVGPAAPQDIRDLRLGIGDNIWGLTWDGTNTDVLRWNFSTDAWDQIVANMVASAPRAMTGSDQYMYSLHANGEIWRIDGAGATKYANDPNTVGTGFPSQNHGEELGLAVAGNKLYALYQQGLFELTLDLTAGLPLNSSSDYTRTVAPGEYPKELSPDTNLRQHLSAVSGGVRFFINVRGEQTAIYEYSGGTLDQTHMLPLGYIATAIRHYANITFIAAQFTNAASAPAESRTGMFYIAPDDLLRFLGYLRFTDTNSQPVSYITSYAHDMYILQGGRLWRYNLGTGGITLENVISLQTEANARALARMDKKFWVAVEGEGTFVADDVYPTTTMWLYSPLWDFDLPDLEKVLLSIEVVNRPLPANTRIEVEHSLDEGAWTSSGATISTTGTVKTRLTISNSTNTRKFRTLQWRVGLTSTDGVDTPRVLSVTPRILVLEYEDSFDLTILLEDDTSGNRLATQQLSGRKKANNLWTHKTNKNLVTFKTFWQSKLPADVDTYTVVIDDPFQEVTEQGQSSMRLRLKVIS